jgi:hypothetical protein
MTIKKVLKTEGVNNSNENTMTFFDEEVEK